MSLNSKIYQPEIEGLRAIAVLAVLLFHLNIDGFSGGFIGVDIFFVISGYLISNNIYNDLEAGKFEFKNFYLRRVCRLLPALLVTVAATLVASYFILTPEHFSRLGASSIAAIFSVSNFLFWSEAGYFDAAKTFKPLLHTWSLGVEEQFYLIWPLLLFFLYSKGKRVGLFSIVLLASVSLIAAQSLLFRHNSMVFYWMPLRISEFAIGALLIFFHRPTMPPWWASFAAVIGLLLMCIPIVIFTDQTAFPGVMALIPCIGTALLIHYGRAPLVYPLLANSVSRHLGKISYSLYLVHWPVIILVSYWKLGGIGTKSLIIVVPVIYLLAWVLHHQVEQRFRLPSVNAAAQGKGLSLMGVSIVIALIGGSILAGNGWPWRYPVEAQVIVKAVESLSTSTDDKRRAIANHQSTFQNQQTIARHYILGDSYAEDTLLALKFSNPDLNVKLLRIRAECQPVLPRRYDELDAVGRLCNEERSRAYDEPNLNDAATIYLAASWREPAFSDLAETIEFLEKNTSANIVIFGKRAGFHDVPTLALKYGKKSGLDEFVSDFRSPQVTQHNDVLKMIVEGSSARFIDVYKLMCPENLCTVISPLDNKIIYSDHAHLTLSGAEYFGELLGKE